jgi:hypothetical protein
MRGTRLETWEIKSATFDGRAEALQSIANATDVALAEDERETLLRIAARYKDESKAAINGKFDREGV